MRLPKTLDDVADDFVVASSTPAALLVAVTERVTRPEPGPDETQRFMFRTLEAEQTDPGVPTDLQVAFAQASLEWLQKSPTSANPFTGMITAGRAINNDIVLAFPTLSALHLTFGRSGQAYTATDQRSTNGTWLNGRRLTERTPQPITPGDFFLVGGSVQLLFLDATALVAFAEERARRASKRRPHP